MRGPSPTAPRGYVARALLARLLRTMLLPPLLEQPANGRSWAIGDNRVEKCPIGPNRSQSVVFALDGPNPNPVMLSR